MKKYKLVSDVLTAAMALTAAPILNVQAAAEQLNRGLAAVSVDGGVYLSWRMYEEEDFIFGTAEENTAYDIYRNGELIGTEENTTNYIDTAGTAESEYKVVKHGESPDSEKSVSPYSGGGNYFDIPLEKPADETIYDPSENELATYSFFPADCSAGDVDGDGEYEIIIKWTSSERDVGSPGDPAYSGTVRFAAYKLDGTKLWENDINLGKNVYSSAHTVQFLVYDFDGDGKAEMMCQTSLGSKDSLGSYVSHSAKSDETISGLTDEENEAADYRGDGRVCKGEEFLTVFNGETGEAMDTINFPTKREDGGASFGDDFGNRSNRFMASVAYLDGIKPYAVYARGYYFGRNGKQRTGISGISFDGTSLSVDYIFDTQRGQPGYYNGAAQYVGQGNHNCTVADVDGDGKDEFITGALCMEVNEKDEFKPRWCTFLQHGDALHIGDYDPTHKGYEFFTVHEDTGTNTMSGTDVEMDYGVSVIDADTGEILFHNAGSDDTGRGIMANIGAGGYYQMKTANAGSYRADGDGRFAEADYGMSQNFRVFWDGDLYDELLDGTSVTSYNGRNMSRIFNAADFDCVKINGTKSNPALQADLFGDWREELVYPTTDGNNLRVFTTTEYTNYKIKSLMSDRVYRAGVAAEQTAYNQPPHIGFYLAEERFNGKLAGIEVNTDNAKTQYYLGEEFDKSGVTVDAVYSDGSRSNISGFSVSGFDPTKAGEQNVIVDYLGFEQEYTVEVVDEIGFEAFASVTEYKVGSELDKNTITAVLKYADGTEKAVTDFNVSELDTMNTGNQNVIVTYKTPKQEYSQTLNMEVVTELDIDTNGTVTGYSGSGKEVVLPYTAQGSVKYRIDSIDGSKVNLYLADTEPDVYAAAYENGRIAGVKQITPETAGNLSIDADFKVDKVFIWESMEPVENTGTQTVAVKSIKDGAFVGSAVEKVYIYDDALTLEGNSIFPEGTVIVCGEGSKAHEYALAHNIAVELISVGDEITFEEDFYTAYNGNMLMQSSAEGVLKADFVSYNTHAADRGPWFKADTYGFMVEESGGNHKLKINSGIYDDRNQFNQVYITLNEPKAVTEKQTVSFDISFPANVGTPYVELQNKEGTVIDTISAAAYGLTNGNTYRYELVYDGAYKATITDSSGNVVKSQTLNAKAGSDILNTIAFKQGFDMRNSYLGTVYIDNVLMQ